MTFPFPITVAPLPSATVSKTDNAVDTTDASTYTFATKSIGAVGSNRLIVVGVSGANATAGRTISAFTIGGVAATQLLFKQTSGGGAFVDVGLYALLVAAGATASVVVTWSAAQLRCGIGIWAAYNILNDTALATAFDSTSSLSTTLSIPAAGIAVGYAGATGASAPTYTWAGLTETFDETVEPNSTHTGANLNAPMIQTGLTVTATPSAYTAGSILMAAWR